MHTNHDEPSTKEEVEKCTRKRGCKTNPTPVLREGPIKLDINFGRRQYSRPKRSDATSEHEYYSILTNNRRATKQKTVSKPCETRQNILHAVNKAEKLIKVCVQATQWIRWSSRLSEPGWL